MSAGCGSAVEDLAAVIGEPVDVEPTEGGCAYDVAGGVVGWESACAETPEQALAVWGLTGSASASDGLILSAQYGESHVEAYTFAYGIANTVWWENWESDGIPEFMYGDTLEAIARIARAHPSPSLATASTHPCPPPYRTAP